MLAENDFETIRHSTIVCHFIIIHSILYHFILIKLDNDACMSWQGIQLLKKMQKKTKNTGKKSLTITIAFLSLKIQLLSLLQCKIPMTNSWFSIVRLHYYKIRITATPSRDKTEILLLYSQLLYHKFFVTVKELSWREPSIIKAWWRVLFCSLKISFVSLAVFFVFSLRWKSM